MGNILLLKGQDHLVVTPTTITDGIIVDGEAFNVTVEAFDGHGEADADYTACQIVLEITAPSGAALAFTVGGASTTEAAMTGGSATFTNVRATIPEGITQVALRARTKLTAAAIKGAGFEAHTYQPEGLASRSACIPVLEFTTAPSGVSRDANFTVTVKLTDGNGTTLETGGTVTLTLLEGDDFDVFASTNARTVDLTMTDGVATSTTLQITGGLGTDAASLRAGMGTYAVVETGSFDINPPLEVRAFRVEAMPSGEKTLPEVRAIINAAPIEWLWSVYPSATCAQVNAAARTCLARGGIRLTGAANATSLKVHFAYVAEANGNLGITFLRGETQPTTGNDLLTGEVVTTRTLLSGQTSGGEYTYEVDLSAALDASDTVYVWWIATQDYENSFGTATGWIGFSYFENVEVS